MDGRCKHGMVVAFCELCSPPVPTTVGSRRPIGPARSLGDPVPPGYDIYVVGGGNRTAAVIRRDIARMPKTTTAVHLGCHPFLWAIEACLERAPRLRLIQVVPSAERKLGAQHRALCAAREVTLRVGAVKPEATGPRASFASAGFLHQKRFMDGLSGGQKEAFDELIRFGFEQAQAAVRYYGLDVDAAVRVSQLEIGVEFGLKPVSANQVISRWIGSVLCYLDPGTKASQEARRGALALRARVERARRIASDVQALQAWIDALGILALPAGLWPSKFEDFEAVVDALRDGRLNQLKERDPRAAAVVIERYGLADLGTDPFKTLAEISEGYGFTREWARLEEAKAFRLMGIVVDEL